MTDKNVERSLLIMADKLPEIFENWDSFDEELQEFYENQIEWIINEAPGRVNMSSPHIRDAYNLIVRITNGSICIF